jgi:hypothetical protein
VHVRTPITARKEAGNDTILVIPAGHDPGIHGAQMTTEPSADQEEHGQESALEWLNTIPNGTIFAYNLDDRKTPGGLKVRWKIRVATGSEAARWDARQAEAIKELLQWASQRHRHRPR